AYVLAPSWDEQTPYYSLFLEEHDLQNGRPPDLLAAEFEACLQKENIEYQTKRESLRLRPVEICVLPDGTWAKWDAERLAKTGGSAEQYKRPCLINDVQFKSKMPVMRTVGC